MAAIRSLSNLKKSVNRVNLSDRYLLAICIILDLELRRHANEYATKMGNDGNGGGS